MNGLILTLYGNYNYGNKLQNYAIQQYLLKHGIHAKTAILEQIEDIYAGITDPKILETKKIRESNFIEFDKKINKIDEADINIEDIDYIFIGSDQVWNSNYDISHQLVDYLESINHDKIIGFSGSVGNEFILDVHKEKYRNHFNKMHFISAREKAGVDVIKNLTNRKDVHESLDPTLLLESEEWESILRKPKQINEVFNGDEKYILTYFLGDKTEKSKERENTIQNIANKYNCKVINILDMNDPFYTCGPSEFLWLEKNAFLICTDSFHSCVFAMLFKRPFVVFNRLEIEETNNMSSRISNFLEKFDLTDRYYNDQNLEDMIKNIDYSNTYKILKDEKAKTSEFVKKAIQK